MSRGSPTPAMTPATSECIGLMLTTTSGGAARASDGDSAAKSSTAATATLAAAVIASAAKQSPAGKDVTSCGRLLGRAGALRAMTALVTGIWICYIITFFRQAADELPDGPLPSADRQPFPERRARPCQLRRRRARQRGAALRAARRAAHRTAP